MAPGGAPRGQATLETALGIVLVIVVIAFGIHIGEVLFLSLKVQEATASAMWDTTSGTLHKLPGTFLAASSVVDSSGQTPGPRAERRYANFDGRQSQLRGGTPTVTQVFTEATGLTVTCRPNVLFPMYSLGGANGVYDQLASAGADGMSCTASATLSSWKAPERFLDKGGGWMLSASAEPSMWQPIQVCGLGRPVGGSCKGQLPMLYDDFGLAGPPEGASDPLNAGAGPYYDSTQQVFARYGRAQGTAASDLARLVVGSSPTDENAFYMSYTGEERNLVQTGVQGDWYTDNPVPTTYPRTPLPTACFLGQRC